MTNKAREKSKKIGITTIPCNFSILDIFIPLLLDCEKTEFVEDTWVSSNKISHAFFRWSLWSKEFPVSLGRCHIRSGAFFFVWMTIHRQHCTLSSPIMCSGHFFWQKTHQRSFRNITRVDYSFSPFASILLLFFKHPHQTQSITV